MLKNNVRKLHVSLQASSPCFLMLTLHLALILCNFEEVQSTFVISTFEELKLKLGKRIPHAREAAHLNVIQVLPH
jgi:hypothetical protein